MSFPTDHRTILGELKVGTTDWVNITSDIRQSDTIDITRGKTDQAGQAAPARCTVTVNNRLGRYSPDNPLGPLYGTLVRNTPLRISIGQGAYGMVLANDGNGSAWTPDSAGTSVTGDIDIRVDMEILTGSTKTWASGSWDVASKYENSDTERSWMLTVTGGQMRFTWWALGTLASERFAISSTTLPSPAIGRKAIRATMDVNNGAGGVDVKFYYATNIDSSWTQLGTTQTSAGTSAIFDGTAGTRVGAAATAGVTPLATVYEAQIMNGIGGSVVASPDFAAQQLDPTPFSSATFADVQANNWTFIGSSDAARIWYGDVDIRFVGELSSLPRKWDTSGNDAWVPIEASGQTRRLGRGTAPAATGLRDYILSQPTTLTSYFPLDGAVGTTYSVNIGQHLTNVSRFYAEGAPVFTYGVDMPSPYLGSAMELNATGTGTSPGSPAMRGDVSSSDEAVAFDFVWQSPALGRLVVELTDYHGDRFQLVIQTPTNSGTLEVQWLGSDGSSTAFGATAQLPELLDTDVHHCRFTLDTSGSDTNFEVFIDGVSVDSGTKTGDTWFGTSLFRLYYARYTDQTIMNIGHLTLWSHPTSLATIPSVANVYQAMLGYAGETAGARITRIAGIGGIPIVQEGAAAETTVMGPQYSEGKLTQIRDAESTDLGILTEPRDQLGLWYRTRASMYNQTPAFTLDYSLGQIRPPFEPLDDDYNTRNIVTAVRREGDSYRVEKTTGPLSTAEPPDGVGEYEDEVTVNVQSDEQLPAVAQWLLALGTIDEPRYKTLAVDLANPNVVAAGLEAAILATEVGDLIRVTNADAAFIYDNINLIAIGYTEHLNWKEHWFEFNCVPASPFEVFSVEGAESRISSGETSELSATMTTTATSMSVLSADATTLWTTAAGDMPIPVMVAGEEMSVTAISGTTPGVAQTFTVTRSVNAVVKTHAVGEIVRLKRRAVWAL